MWELRGYVGRDPLTGRKRYETKTVTVLGRREADKALAAFVTALGSEGAVADGTFGELVERWVATASVGWSPANAVTVGNVVSFYLAPLLPLRTTLAVYAHFSRPAIGWPPTCSVAWWCPGTGPSTAAVATLLSPCGSRRVLNPFAGGNRVGSRRRIGCHAARRSDEARKESTRFEVSECQLDDQLDRPLRDDLPCARSAGRAVRRVR